MNLQEDDESLLPSFGAPVPTANNVLVPTMPTRVQEDEAPDEEEALPMIDPSFRQYPASGPMWSNLAQGLDQARDSVFRRVENPNMPHRFLPQQLLPGYSMNINTQNGVAFEDAVQYAASGNRGMDTAATTAYVTNQLLRGEMNMAVNPATPYRWERDIFCTHTLFPAKFTRTVGKKVDTFFMSYYCFYSSFPIRPPAGSWDPQYTPYVLNKDATISGETPSGATVNIDRALLNDENSLLSIVASCENAYALNGAYLTFIPRIDPILFRTSTHWSDPSKYTIGGASLGLSVFAAIKGWLPILYTGYLNAPMPGARLLASPEERAAMSNAKYNNTSWYAPATSDNISYGPYYDDKPWYLNPSQAVSRSDAPRAWNGARPILARYMAQPNFVESVGAVFSKIVYAVTHRIPIFIPMQTSFRTDMVTYIAKFRSNPKAIQWMGLVPTYYLASMMEDGYPQVTSDEGAQGNYSIPNIFMPLTITDASALQLRLFRNLALKNAINVRVGFAGGAARNAQTTLFNAAENAMVKIAAQEYQREAALRVAERDDVEKAREDAKKRGLNKEQTFQRVQQAKQQYTLQRDQRKTAKKNARDLLVRAGKRELDNVRATKKAAEVKRRDDRLAEQAKFRKIENPTEQQKQEYRQALQRIKNLKKPSIKATYARDAGLVPAPKKFRKTAEGTYDDETKLQMKALKQKNNKLINAYPAFNLGQRSSSDISKARQAAMQQQQRDAAAYRALQRGNNQAAVANNQAPAQNNQAPAQNNQTPARVSIRSRFQNQAGNQNEESGSDTRGRFRAQPLGSQFLGGSDTKGIFGLVGEGLDDILDL